MTDEQQVARAKVEAILQEWRETIEDPEEILIDDVIDEKTHHASADELSAWGDLIDEMGGATSFISLYFPVPGTKTNDVNKEFISVAFKQVASKQEEQEEQEEAAATT